LSRSAPLQQPLQNTEPNECVSDGERLHSSLVLGASLCICYEYTTYSTCNDKEKGAGNRIFAAKPSYQRSNDRTIERPNDHHPYTTLSSDRQLSLPCVNLCPWLSGPRTKKLSPPFLVPRPFPLEIGRSLTLVGIGRHSICSPSQYSSHTFASRFCVLFP
jgi:hypothetical protein